MAENQQDLAVHFPAQLIRKKKSYTGGQQKKELEKEVAELRKLLNHEQKVHEFLQKVYQRKDDSSFYIPNYLPPKVKLAKIECDVNKEKENNNIDKSKQGLNNKMRIQYQQNNISSSSLPPNSKVRVVANDHQEEEENQFHHKRISRKSGMIKTPSPLREPTPRKELQKYPNLCHAILTEAMQSPFLTEEDTIHRWPPNKLSENIMKCLVFIYLRLLRTTRAMELEKSSSIATHHEPNSKNSSSTSLLIQQKDLRQQDPYGIFDPEKSIPRDIGPYKNLVRFGSTSMEPKCISNSNSIPLFQKLKLMMNSLQNVDLRLLNYQQKLAFWINISTPEKLLSLMNKSILNIGENTINAHAIEHFIPRKPLNSHAKEVNRKGEIKNDIESIVRELHGLESFDPNVKMYTSDGVVCELEKSKLEHLQASLIVTSTKKIAMPELLLRNIHDFAQDLDSLVEWICQQLPTSGSLRKSIVDCFKGIHGGSKASTFVEKIPYVFEFRYLLSV
ncbi:unnamed protein product [Withania somnifera]